MRLTLIVCCAPQSLRRALFLLIGPLEIVSINIYLLDLDLDLLFLMTCRETILERLTK